VVYGAALEMLCGVKSHRGFESLPLRKFLLLTLASLNCILGMVARIIQTHPRLREVITEVPPPKKTEPVPSPYREVITEVRQSVKPRGPSVD
jgi:hypothetical protein